jgi:four helix bundle protein
MLSVPSNIAEGCGRRTDAEMRRYIHNSLGSLLEVESSLEIARRTNVIHPTVHRKLATRITVLRRMLISLARNIDNRLQD